MSTSIRTRLIKIGNSQGIRLPKMLVEQIGFDREVELEIQDGQLVLRPVAHARAGWDAQFRAAAELGDTHAVTTTAHSADRWDEDEWQW